MQPRAAILACMVVAACADAGPVATVHTARGPVRIAVEVVADDASRARGLMYRDRLADGHGMLFVFDETTDHAFWMKNTLIPLDIVFVGDDRRVVGIRANATPLSLASIAVGRPSRWVLEVPGGYAGRVGIAVGDAIDLPSPARGPIEQ